MDWSREGLLASGFSRFERASAWRDWIATVLSEPGVYIVLRQRGQEPSFLASSAGGHFKGRDPTTPKERLEREWVHEAEVLYIGKADLLRRRINKLMRFADGEPVDHWGGRFLWQVEGHREFEVAWLPTPEERPVNVEAALLIAFKDEFGQLPYANIQEPQHGV